MYYQGVVQFSTPRLQTFWRYAKVEFKPPTPGELPEITKGLTELLNSAKTGKWQKLSVKVRFIFDLMKWLLKNY